MKRIAMFPGSFDPFTAGHLNILKRALTMFDEVVVAVGVNIDKRGLDAIDNKILKTIITKFKGGPVGANTIATAVGEDQGTLEEVYEPFLIKEGFIMRTPRGREATDLAYKHLGLEKGNINLDDPTLF